MNICTFVGRLTRDPETRTVGTDKSVTNFALAVNSKFKKDKVLWLDCQLWNAAGKVVQEYVKKGNQLSVTGELEQDEYENKDGVKVKAYRLNVQDFTLAPRSDAVSNDTAAEPVKKPASKPAAKKKDEVVLPGDDGSDSIPF